MEWLLIGALGASALASIGSAVSNYFSTRSTNATNMAIARENREWDAAQIEKQNQYNSPANQMQRFLDAGLNPNLIYSQGSAGLQSTAAKSQMPSLQVPQFGESFGINQALDQFRQMAELKASLAVKQSQVALNKANTDKAAADAANKVASQGYLKSRSDWAEIFNQNRNLSEFYRNTNASMDLRARELFGELFKKSGDDEETAYARGMAQQMFQKYRQIQTVADANSLMNEMRRHGLNPNDPAYMRLITLLVTKVADKFGLGKLLQYDF